MDIRWVKEPARTFVGVRRRVPPEGIGPACGEILPRVWNWITARGLRPASAPATLYHAHDDGKREFDLQPGVFVEGPVEGEGDITVVALPACEAAALTHAGPYERLGESWGAVEAFLRAAGRTPRMPSWEVYVTDPAEAADPSALRTEIVYPAT